MQFASKLTIFMVSVCLPALTFAQYYQPQPLYHGSPHLQAMASDVAVANTTSPFLLNFVNKDLALFSRDSNMYNVKEGSDYIRGVFNRYLETGSYQNYLIHCHHHYEKFSHLTDNQINAAIAASIEELERYRAADAVIVREVESARFASRFIQQISWETRFTELITENLIKANCISKLEAVVDLSKFGLNQYSSSYVSTYAPVTCKAAAEHKFNCNYNSKYPAYDGSCNNPKNPRLGMAYTCHRRLLPPDFADGVKAMRRSVTGQELPNARLISNVMLPDVPEVNSHQTQMLMQWGQSIVHDQSRTPITLGNSPLCCPPQSHMHPECSTVSVPEIDTLNKRWNQTCLRQVRSSPCTNCALGPRQQLNAATSTMDLSHLYGYTYADALKHRSFDRGQVAMAPDAYNGPIMPTAQGWFDPITLQACNVPAQFPQFQCFKSGDGTRATQHPGIAALQTLLLRRHNQHALALHAINPHWNDEQLFLEARRLLSAEANHITYNEYMPEIFSEELVAYFRLKPLPHGYSKYDPDTDIRTLNEWAAAAGRFGHSQINNIFTVKNANGEVYTYNMRDVFFEPSLIHLGQTEGIIKGLVSEPTMHVDPFFVTDVKDFMYQSPNRTSGLDLLVLNIARGRDHGIPGYVNYLDYCFSYKVKDWSDLTKYIPERQIYRLQQYYSDVADIDLFVGGVSERRLQGNVMGPTFACINAIQWHHAKYGDRYFYEHGPSPSSFTEAQLANIKATTTLARLICKTAPSIKYIQPNVFRFASEPGNHELPCENYPEFDYSLWKDNYYKK